MDYFEEVDFFEETDFLTDFADADEAEIALFEMDEACLDAACAFLAKEAASLAAATALALAVFKDALDLF